MGIDIKLPIGLMFTILGLMLVLFGISTWGDAAFYTRSLGLNINLWSGSGMLLFGVIMLLLSRRKTKSKSS